MTPRQRRVAARVADALTDKQIADALGISEQTVRIHIVAIARRWQLDSTRNIRVQITRRVLLI